MTFQHRISLLANRLDKTILFENMKFTSVALYGAALGLAHANPVAKRSISDGMLFSSDYNL